MTIRADGQGEVLNEKVLLWLLCKKKNGRQKNLWITLPALFPSSFESQINCHFFKANLQLTLRLLTPPLICSQ